MPIVPHIYYKNKGWKSWGDFLGTDFVAHSLRKYRSFKEAKSYVQKLKIKTVLEWKKYTKSDKLPKDIPAYPTQTYENKGWKSWGDFLGTGFVAASVRKYRSFKEAKSYAQKLKFKSSKGWVEHTKSGRLPKDIPAYPRGTYKNKGWKDWGDFLGTGNIASHLINYRPFNKAKSYVQKLKIKTGAEWRKYCHSGKLPKDIPVVPRVVYKNKGWKSMGNFLGTGRVSSNLRKYRSFKKAKIYAKKLNIKSHNDWIQHSKLGKLPKDIPVIIGQTYKSKGWKGWGDFLGTGRKRGGIKKDYYSFSKAKNYIRKFNIRSSKEWYKFSKTDQKPLGIPSMVDRIYKNKGWQGWEDFLGTG